jgi:hypothetical protein
MVFVHEGSGDETRFSRIITLSGGGVLAACPPAPSLPSVVCRFVPLSVRTPFFPPHSALVTGEYRVNDRTVSWEEYDAGLAKLGIVTKTRNFLIFQVLHSAALSCVPFCRLPYMCTLQARSHLSS